MPTYIVSFRESAVVTERIDAPNAAMAIERVKWGEGDRLGFEIDEKREPSNFRAVRDRGTR